MWYNSTVIYRCEWRWNLLVGVDLKFKGWKDGRTGLGQIQGLHVALPQGLLGELKDDYHTTQWNAPPRCYHSHGWNKRDSSKL